MIRTAFIGAIAALLGSVIGMHGYLSTIPNRVPQQDRERAYFISIAHTGTGAAIATGTALLLSGLLLKDKAQADRDVIQRFAKQQAANTQLPVDERASWMAIAESLENDHQPTTHQSKIVKFPLR